MAYIVNGMVNRNTTKDKICKAVTYQGKKYTARGNRDDEEVILTPVLAEGVIQDVHTDPCLLMPMDQFLSGNYR